MSGIKRHFQENKNVKEKRRAYFHITVGIVLAAFSFSFFLNPRDIVIGGISGLGVIIKKTFEMKPFWSSIFMLGLNLILLSISLLFIGRDFFFKTVYGAVAFPVCCFIFDLIFNRNGQPTAESLDMTLVILFSSLMMGYGLGTAMKYGGSSGGTEIGQKICYQSFHLSYSVSLFIIDGTIIFLGYLLLDQNLEDLLYEIVFVILSGFMMDIAVFSGFNKRCVYIISEKSEEIKKMLLEDLARGVTSVNVVGEYSNRHRQLIICLMSSAEYNKVRQMLDDIDPEAFYYCMRANEVRGKGFSYYDD